MSRTTAKRTPRQAVPSAGMSNASKAEAVAALVVLTLAAIWLAYEINAAGAPGSSINGSLWRRLPADRAAANKLAAADPTGAIASSIRSVDTAHSATDPAAAQEQAAGLMPSY